MDCLFCGIVAGSIPAQVIYQDAGITAFRDINPQSPVHVLLILDEHFANPGEMEAQHEAPVGRLIRAAARLAAQEGVAESGYRLVVNAGPDANQTVPHLHVHLLGGRAMTWPPG